MSTSFRCHAPKGSWVSERVPLVAGFLNACVIQERSRMAIFKKKLSLSKLITDSAVFILTNDNIFPSRDALLEQDKYTNKELDDIEMHSRLLALSYLYIAVYDYAKRGKFSGRYDEHRIGMIYGQAILAANAAVGGKSFEESYILQQIDNYNAGVVKMREADSKDDYFHAYLIFEQSTIGNRKPDNKPVSAITLGKLVRDEVVKKLMGAYVKDYKVTID